MLHSNKIIDIKYNNDIINLLFLPSNKVFSSFHFLRKGTSFLLLFHLNKDLSIPKL